MSKSEEKELENAEKTGEKEDKAEVTENLLQEKARKSLAEIDTHGFVFIYVYQTDRQTNRQTLQTPPAFGCRQVHE